MRQSIIRHTAESYQPDIMIVDKEPLGMRGELQDTLSFLKTHGTTLVLGLRDVMDSPSLLQAEWARHNVLKRVEALYDSVWVYGPADFWDPLTGFDVPASIESRKVFTGFLERSLPHKSSSANRPEGHYLLVTAGGGGDGAELMNQVLDTYAAYPDLQRPLLLVLGPLMPAEERDRIRARAKAFPRATVIEFDNRMEALIDGAKAIVSMGGYNTFCEILSFDKRALLVPRVRPREEQLIRARRAAELGIIDMLEPAEAADPARLAVALEAVYKRPRPSKIQTPMKLGGLAAICDLVDGWLARNSQRRLIAVEGRH